MARQFPDLRLTANLSSRDFDQSDLSDTISCTLSRNGLAAGRSSRSPRACPSKTPSPRRPAPAEPARTGRGVDPRFRHRLFVPREPAALRRHPPEDRPQLRRDMNGHGNHPHHQRHRRYRPGVRHPPGRRRRRARRTDADPRRHGLRRDAGFTSPGRWMQKPPPASCGISALPREPR